MPWLSFHSEETVRRDLWCFSASQAFAVRACFLSLFHLWPAIKTRPYSRPLWPPNLTARLLNASCVRLWEASLSLFPPSSPSSPLLSSCTACAHISPFSPPAWVAVALSESSEFPVHCSVSAWKHHRCQHLVKLQKKKNKESDGMKMSVMANRTLSHSYNISVTDYQTGDTNTHTHTQMSALTNISTRGALITLREPDDTDLEIKQAVMVKGWTWRRTL